MLLSGEVGGVTTEDCKWVNIQYYALDKIIISLRLSNLLLQTTQALNAGKER